MAAAASMGRCRGGMARVLSLIIMSAFAFTAVAQVVVEDDIVTRDVILIDPGTAAGGYSITAAMGMSLALPGAGHYYMDKPGSAFVYMSLDAASIFGAILFNSFANQREREARSFAHAAAGIEKAPAGEAYWRHIGRFMGAAEYNEAVELSRGEADDLYREPETWWRWGDESQQDEYNSLRQKARNMRVASSFFVGALVANRLVSAVDLRVFQKKSLSRGIKFEPTLSPDLGGASLSLRADF